VKKAEIMEVETMLDDDVFFAELSKRISLLITDDDEGADFSAAQFIPAAAAAAAPLQVSEAPFPSPRPLQSSSSMWHARVVVVSGPGPAGEP
jgi:hypothetical protein